MNLFYRRMISSTDDCKSRVQEVPDLIVGRCGLELLSEAKLEADIALVAHAQVASQDAQG